MHPQQLVVDQPRSPVSDQNQPSVSGLHQVVSHRVGSAVLAAHQERDQHQDEKAAGPSNQTHALPAGNGTTCKNLKTKNTEYKNLWDNGVFNACIGTRNQTF